MSRFIKILLAIAILAGIGLAITTSDQQPADDQATSTPATSTDDVAVPDDWQQYENARFDFRVAYPPEAGVQAEGPSNRHIKFTLLGPDNATGEITDGFTFTVSTYEDVTGSLQAFAERQAADNPAADSVSEVTETTFQQQPAYRYSTETLGTVEHIVTAHSSNRVVTLSYNISDPNDRDYQATVNQMLASLSLTDIAGGDAAADGSVSQVELALLDTDLADGQEPERGCDLVASITRDITPTQAPLTAALEELFALERTDVQGFYNFIAKTNDTLAFDTARVEDGTAHIYLTGELSGLAGVCDNPRARIQIEETALQFSTVETVQIYLNGEATELQPSGQ